MENSQLILGQTPLYALIPVQVDNNGHLQIDMLSMPSIPAGANLIGAVGIEGYYSGNWQKAPIPWGASVEYGQNWQNLNLPAGASSQLSGALVANSWTVITSWAIQIVTISTSATATLIRYDGGALGTQRPLITFTRFAAGTWFNWSGQLICKSTDLLGVLVTNVNLNDDLYVSVNGYSVALNL